MGRFGVGQPVRRIEDERLLTGHGRYSDDLRLDGECWAVFVRSPVAHGRIRGVDTEEATAMPGVLGVFTSADLDADGIGDIPCLARMPGKGGTRALAPSRPSLARHKVRHVGDPVAVVVAESLAAAREAADTVMLDIEEMPAVSDARAALAKDAPQVWDEVPDNLSLDWEKGDRQATDEGFAKAAHAVRLELVNNRIVVNSMEPRAAIGAYDADTQHFTLHTSTQGSHRIRSQLAEHIFNLPPEQFRVVTPDVGGGFGMKIFLFPEHVVVLWAARHLGRPVRWSSERSEAFLTDTQGRDHITTAELALDADGKALALRVHTIAAMGAYLSNFAPFIPTGGYGKMLPGLYSIPAAYAEVKCVLSNTASVDAYRGAGRPEAAFVIERLIDKAARELRLRPEELRRRNFISPAELPYTTAMGEKYDSGDFPELMGRAMQAAGWDGFEERRKESLARGRLRGIGMACYVEACGGIGEESAHVRVTADGEIVAVTGTQTNGQGHATAYAQILSEHLGIEPTRVRVHQGDTDEIETGGGTGGSRSLLMGGRAIEEAALRIRERVRSLAAEMLEASPTDLELTEGTVTVVGTDRSVSLADVARKASAEGQPLDEDGAYTAEGMTYPNGCHICELEIDEETGHTCIANYVIMDDFGKVVNPLLVAGQVHGGTVQGIGQALLEHTVYDPESAQLLSGSFMDYCLPRADDLPSISLTLLEEWPCPTNGMGIKGAGEAGAIGACPAVMNALVDALAPFGIQHIDMPATSETIWQALAGARERRAAE